MGTIRLSVLICGLVGRKSSRERVKAQLNVSGAEQSYEIVENVDRGEIAVADKRNLLLQEARGDYVCFVDDDDEVSTDYVRLVLDALDSSPDCVGIEGVLRTGDGFKFPFYHSIDFAGWYNTGNEFYRWPNHLNPIRRDLALQTGFRTGIEFGEDQDYSYRIRPLLKTEEYIDQPIYFYNCTKLRVGDK